MISSDIRMRMRRRGRFCGGPWTGTPSGSPPRRLISVRIASIRRTCFCPALCSLSTRIFSVAYGSAREPITAQTVFKYEQRTVDDAEASLHFRFSLFISSPWAYSSTMCHPCVHYPLKIPTSAQKILEMATFLLASTGVESHLVGVCTSRLSQTSTQEANRGELQFF